MKKNLIVLSIVFIFLSNVCFAQKTVAVANRNTALRCLKLAENNLMGNDFNGALRQAELGLSYDDSISDLVYVKAAAYSGLGKSKADVLSVIQQAFKIDNWVGYSKNGARLLIADLLCDTGDYTESLNYLDAEPFIYSADAEFIRIKNYYRIGTADSIEQARLKINSARRIYSKDARFPNIFFLFEELYMALDAIFNRENASETNALVQTIADSYIAKLPDYKDENPELELLAAFFAKGEEQVRLVKAIDAKSKTPHPLLAILGVKTGLYSPEVAFEHFVKASNGYISLITFEFFMQNLQSDEIFNLVAEYFTNFEGSIYIDSNYDLQTELIVDYEVGRPKYINFDGNNDGHKEIYCVCDFGVPKTIYLMNNLIEYDYDEYPAVCRVHYEESGETLNYLYNDYIYYPFELAKEPFLDIMGLEFYVPVAGSITYPDTNDLTKAASIELPGVERDNSRIVYTLNQGEPVSGKFYEGDIQYAYCDFETGIPFVRYADYDHDGYFETSELYDIYDIGKNFVTDNSEIVKKVFQIFPEDDRLYLRKVSIDRNANTYCEYSEEYLEDNGSICSWDTDDNGVLDYQHITYPRKEGDSLKEETVFYNDNGTEKLSVQLIDGIPYSMKSNGREIVVFAGKTKNIYWIEDKGSAELEEALLPKIKAGLEQGSVDVIQINKQRVSVIKIGELYFVKILPATLVEEE